MAPFSSQFRHKSVGVLGLGRSGMAAVRTLKDHDARPVAFDDDPSKVRDAQSLGAQAGGDHIIQDLAALIVSPGVPLRYPKPHRIVQLAHRAAIPILADLDLFQEINVGRPVIGITGTNGKSTTTALIHHLLIRAGHKAQAGGNLGTAVLDLKFTDPHEPAVLELSSFQLDLVTCFRCNIAIWLNIDRDHLERHGGMAGYIEAKQHIFDRQGPADSAVICTDDPASAEVFDTLCGMGRDPIEVSTKKELRRGVMVQDGILIDALGPAPHRRFDLTKLDCLKGRHNHQNIAAAYAALIAHGLTGEQALMGLSSFPGLPHRAERVGEIQGIQLINDSKATNPAAAIPSLKTFDNIFWLAGGRNETGGFEVMLDHLDHVRSAYLFGEAAPAIAGVIGDAVPVSVFQTMDQAFDAGLQSARDARHAPATLLLAPACKSFDQFQDFEARGDTFRTLAQQASGGHAA